MSKCESCGVAWSKHLGITGTCKRVQEQAAEIKRLQAEIERWHKIERERWTGWAQQLFDVKQNAIRSASCNDPQAAATNRAGCGVGKIS